MFTTRFLAAARHKLQVRNYMNAIEMKGTSTEYKSLSPFSGLLFRELKAPESLYKMRHSAAASVRLSQDLFHLNGEEFRSTYNRSKVGYFLTPQLIATIMHHLHRETFDLPETREAICAELLKITQKSQNKITRKKIYKFLKLISWSKSESGLHFPEHTIENLLLSFLCYRADTRSAINEYLTCLQQLEPEITMMADQNVEFDEMDLQEGRKALKALAKTKDPSEKQQILAKNYENIMASLMITIDLAKVVGASYGVDGKPPRPNCMEATLHNLFNILLKDGERFDLSLLPARLQPHETLQELYRMQSYRITKVNSSEVGQYFMKMVSGLPGVSYLMEGYEMLPNVNNVIATLNHCFGSHATSLQELSRQFSDARREIIFEQRSSDITITISTPGKEISLIVIYLKSHHAEISAPTIFKLSETMNFPEKFSLPDNCDRLMAYMLQNKTQLPSLLRDNENVSYTELMSFYMFSEPTTYNVNHFTTRAIPYLNTHPELKNILLFGFPQECSATIADAIYHAMGCHSAIVTTFIENLDVNDLQNSIGDELLIRAIVKPVYGIHFIKLLLDKGANPNAKDDQLPVIFLVTCPKIMTLLLEKGADPNARSMYDGKTPLHDANNYYNDTKLLLEYKADPNAQDDFGATPLHKCYRSDVAKLLLASGANPNSANRNNETPLHTAQGVEIIRLLLENGADVTAQSEDGSSVLHKWVNNQEAVSLLLAHHADPNVLNNRGNPPLYYSQNTNVIQLLLMHGADRNVDNDTVKFYLEACPYIQQNAGEVTKTKSVAYTVYAVTCAVALGLSMFSTRNENENEEAVNDASFEQSNLRVS